MYKTKCVYQMGIKSLFGFGQARDKPIGKAADAGYSFFFGMTTSGKPVNATTAMQTTAVYACVRILSEAVASLPIWQAEKERSRNISCSARHFLIIYSHGVLP